MEAGVGFAVGQQDDPAQCSQPGAVLDVHQLATVDDGHPARHSQHRCDTPPHHTLKHEEPVC